MRKRDTRGIMILVALLILGIGGTVVAARGGNLLRLLTGRKANSQYETAVVQRGDVSATVGASGNTHSRQSAQLAWRVTGTVTGLAVQAGDTVQAGEVLAKLKDDSVPASLIVAHFDLIDAQKALDTLLQSKSQQAAAQQALANAQKALQDALDEQAKLKMPNASPSNIEGAQANLDQADAAVKQAEQIYSLMEGRPQDDIQRIQAAANLERARRFQQSAQINLQFAQNKPNAQKAEQVNAQAAVAQANLADAQREWDRVKDGPSPDDIQSAKARIDGDLSTVSMATMAAPMSGTVSELDMMNGDSAVPGQTVMLIEDLSEMHVQVDVPEVDISKVKAGQETTVTFDAIPKRSFKGQVLSVSQFGTQRQGNTYFEVQTRLDNADRAIKTGMTGAVDITVASAKNVLLVPNRAIRSSKGQRVVYVLRDQALTQVPVTLGISDDTKSELLTGNLKEGDIVVLNPPTTGS